MATAKKKPTKSETAVALRANGGEVVTYDYGAAAGKGWENTSQDDFSIPFINQLQALSDEVQDPDDGGVEGAKPGMFVNSVTKQLSSEVIFVPCRTEHAYVEWVPRDSGSGFVGLHALDSAVVREAKAQSADGRNLKTEAGNDLVETYYVYAAILNEVNDTDARELGVIAFTKTKIKRYKAIMTRLRTLKGSSSIPLFAHQIRMKSTKEKNSAGQIYYNVELNPAVEGDIVASLLQPDNPLLEQAQSFLESLDSGEARVNYESAEAAKDEVF